MLAQNFLPHDALGLTEAGRDALVTVLGMLERDELVFHPGTVPTIHNGFNMRSLRAANECGTVCCIAGWAWVLCGHQPFDYADRQGFSQRLVAWDKLITPRGFRDGTITVPQAARALRSYLTTGEPNWEGDYIVNFFATRCRPKK